jgi:hypothetical protein
VKDLAELRQLSAGKKVAFFGLNYRAFGWLPSQTEPQPDAN